MRAHPRAAATVAALTCLLAAGCAAPGGTGAEPAAIAASTPAPTPTPTAQTFELSGSISVTALLRVPTGPGCLVSRSDYGGGYDDMEPGAQVTVTDASGDIVATGNLDEGHFIKTTAIPERDDSAVGDAPMMPDVDIDDDAAWDAAWSAYMTASDEYNERLESAPMVDVDYGVCGYDFTIAGIPDEDFLSVEVAHRGKVTYSRADLEASDWAIALTL